MLVENTDRFNAINPRLIFTEDELNQQVDDKELKIKFVRARLKLVLTYQPTLFNREDSVLFIIPETNIAVAGPLPVPRGRRITSTDIDVFVDVSLSAAREWAQAGHVAFIATLSKPTIFRLNRSKPPLLQDIISLPITFRTVVANTSV